MGFSGGIGRNYISLIDFLFFFFATKVFYNLELTNDYIKACTVKSYLMALLFVKDVVIIVLSLTSGNYNARSGWGEFGYFWLRTLGKMSIVLSLSKILFFRLNYFSKYC